MNIRKVPDIRLRCYDNNNQLIWKSLRGENIKAGGEWRPILPGKYRLSHEGYWYELGKLLEIITNTWGGYKTSLYTKFQIKTNITNLPEPITLKLSKSDELVSKEYKIESSELTIDNPFTTYSNSPVICSFVLDNGNDVSSSSIAGYTIVNKNLLLPYLAIDGYMGNEPIESSFSPAASFRTMNVVSNRGDINTSHQPVESTSDWKIHSVSDSWITATRESNFIKVEVTNSGESDREGLVVLQHNPYSFITKSILVKQNKNQGSIIIDPEWILIDVMWEITDNYPADSDLDGRCAMTGNPISNDSVGYRVNSREDPYGIMFWGGDSTQYVPIWSTTGKRGETYCIDIKKLREMLIDYPSAVIVFTIQGGWYSRYYGLPCSLRMSSYKGGTKSINNTTKQITIENGTLQNVPATSISKSIPGKEDIPLATLTYNIVTNIATWKMLI